MPAMPISREQGAKVVGMRYTSRATRVITELGIAE